MAFISSLEPTPTQLTYLLKRRFPFLYKVIVLIVTGRVTGAAEELTLSYLKTQFKNSNVSIENL
jgi:hypothetical protein